MIKVKLPESFKKIEWTELFDLVDNFIYLNKRSIPSHQLKNWFEPRHEIRVPSLFMTLVREEGFEFPKNSEINQYRCPDVEYLRCLTSDMELKKEETRLKRIKELKSQKRVNMTRKIQSIKTYKCFNENCAHYNSDLCTTTPIHPEVIDGIITDCIRFKTKEFKFKTWNQVFDLSPEP